MERIAILIEQANYSSPIANFNKLLTFYLAQRKVALFRQIWKDG
jgi:hypothetical protein